MVSLFYLYLRTPELTRQRICDTKLEEEIPVVMLIGFSDNQSVIFALIICSFRIECYFCV